MDHDIFARWFRYYDVCHALTQEVPTFLAAPEWCTMSWSNIKKNDSDRLVDIIADYANVRDRVKYLEDIGSSPAELHCAESLLLSCLKLNDQLSKWLEDLEKTLPGPMFSAIPGATTRQARSSYPSDSNSQTSRSQ